MKKLFTRLLVLALALTLTACGGQTANGIPPEGEDDGIVCPAGFDGMEELLAAARAEGELTVCGSCEEAYLAAACQRFEELFGIPTTYQYVASGSVQTQSQGTPGHPAADVWFGGSAEDCAACGDAGLLASYDAAHASHLTDDLYRDAEGLWYGISVDPLGFVVDRDMLKRMAIDAPTGWAELLDFRYQELLWTSNYTYDGAGQLLLRAVRQQPELFGGDNYLLTLDENVALYAASDAAVTRCLGTGECVIGISFLSDGIARIEDGCTNLRLVLPAEGTPCRIAATAIFKGAAHPNAAKLWTEFALSPACVELAAANGCFQFPVLGNAQRPSTSAAGLDLRGVVALDQDESADVIDACIEETMTALAEAGADVSAERFQTP